MSTLCYIGDTIQCKLIEMLCIVFLCMCARFQWQIIINNNNWCRRSWCASSYRLTIVTAVLIHVFIVVCSCVTQTRRVRCWSTPRTRSLTPIVRRSPVPESRALRAVPTATWRSAAARRGRAPSDWSGPVTSSSAQVSDVIHTHAPWGVEFRCRYLVGDTRWRCK